MYIIIQMIDVDFDSFGNLFAYLSVYDVSQCCQSSKELNDKFKKLADKIHDSELNRYFRLCNFYRTNQIMVLDRVCCYETTNYYMEHGDIVIVRCKRPQYNRKMFIRTQTKRDDWSKYEDYELTFVRIENNIEYWAIICYSDEHLYDFAVCLNCPTFGELWDNNQNMNYKQQYCHVKKSSDRYYATLSFNLGDFNVIYDLIGSKVKTFIADDDDDPDQYLIFETLI